MKYLLAVRYCVQSSHIKLKWKRLFVCVCVCVDGCVCLFVTACVLMGVCVCLCMRVRWWVWVFVCECVCVDGGVFVCVCVYVDGCVCLFVFACVLMGMLVDTNKLPVFTLWLKRPIDCLRGYRCSVNCSNVKRKQSPCIQISHFLLIFDYWLNLSIRNIYGYL